MTKGAAPLTISGTGRGTWVRASMRGVYTVDGTDGLPVPAGNTVAVQLSWRAGAPYEVGITIELSRSVSLNTYVDRSLLADGLRQVYGLPSGVPADVRCLSHVTTHAVDGAHVLTRWRYAPTEPLRALLLLDGGALAAVLSTLATLVAPGAEAAAAQVDWAGEMWELLEEERDAARRGSGGHDSTGWDVP